MLNHNRAIERLGAYNRGYASDHTFVRAMTGAGERQGCCYRRNGIRRVVVALVEQIGRRIDEEGIRRDDSMRAPSLAKVARFIETAFREQQAAQMQAHDPDEAVRQGPAPNWQTAKWEVIASYSNIGVLPIHFPRSFEVKSIIARCATQHLSNRGPRS